jgi:hypothetical protein
MTADTVGNCMAGMQLTEMKPEQAVGVGGSIVTDEDRIKVQRFDGCMSWTMFCRQFAAVAKHDNWSHQEKATHPFAIVQAKAADILHIISAEVTYKDIVKVLEGCYRDHELATAHCSQLKGPT